MTDELATTDPHIDYTRSMVEDQLAQESTKLQVIDERLGDITQQVKHLEAAHAQLTGQRLVAQGRVSVLQELLEPIARDAEPVIEPDAEPAPSVDEPEADPPIDPEPES
jgi:hypothetical protein